MQLCYPFICCSEPCQFSQVSTASYLLIFMGDLVVGLGCIHTMCLSMSSAWSCGNSSCTETQLEVGVSPYSVCLSISHAIVLVMIPLIGLVYLYPFALSLIFVCITLVCHCGMQYIFAVGFNGFCWSSLRNEMVNGVHVFQCWKCPMIFSVC